jgi:hypothetical protein
MCVRQHDMLVKEREARKRTKGTDEERKQGRQVALKADLPGSCVCRHSREGLCFLLRKTQRITTRGSRGHPRDLVIRLFGSPAVHGRGGPGRGFRPAQGLSKKKGIE